MFMRCDYELIFVTYFTQNAQERAVMLHEVIFYGKWRRQVRFPRIILNELRRKNWRNKFSWVLQLFHGCFKIRKKKDVICPGCFQKFKIEKAPKVTVTNNEIKMECQPCNNCYKGYLELMDESNVSSYCICKQYLQTLHKNQSFPLRLSSLNVTKSAVSCGFGHSYWGNR